MVQPYFGSRKIGSHWWPSFWLVFMGSYYLSTIQALLLLGQGWERVKVSWHFPPLPANLPAWFPISVLLHSGSRSGGNTETRVCLGKMQGPGWFHPTQPWEWRWTSSTCILTEEASWHGISWPLLRRPRTPREHGFWGWAAPPASLWVLCSI